MRVLIHRNVFKDTKKCSRKKWYIGADKEFPGVIKLLRMNSCMPGEAPYHHTPKELHGSIFHARISLPRCNIGKRKGPRMIYYRNRTESEIKVLYFGGHKDRVYDTNKIVNILQSRFLSEDFVGQY